MKLRGYISSRSFMGERVPQNVQNIVIREYCIRNKYQYLLSVTEFSMDDSYCIFQELVDKLSDIDGIAAYSLFQLPMNDQVRLNCLYKVVRNNKQIHFASESLVISNEEDVQRIELIWFVKKTL